jgi:aryl-alcohol dehydrogenase-like predicted oxidoreductase
VQIIANAFRLKPLDEVFPAAAEAGVGVIVRVPLASGLLSGRYDANTTFADDDHRSFNRDGSAFDVGETFSGVNYETGLVAAKEFGDLVTAEAPPGTSSAQAAIAWLWQHDAVSTVIPGARNVEQARSNAAAGRVPPLGRAFDDGVHRIYETHLRAAVHDRW